jgi:hypothetical protein
MMWRRCLYPLWPSARHCFALIATIQPFQRIEVDRSVRRRRFEVELEKSSWSLHAFSNGSRLDHLNVGIRCFLA